MTGKAIKAGTIPAVIANTPLTALVSTFQALPLRDSTSARKTGRKSLHTCLNAGGEGVPAWDGGGGGNGGLLWLLLLLSF